VRIALPSTFMGCPYGMLHLSDSGGQRRAEIMQQLASGLGLPQSRVSFLRGAVHGRHRLRS
jgi:hypothetical protein